VIEKIGRWIAAHGAALAIAVLLIAALIGAGAVVLSIADRTDGMREAQTGLAELSNLATGLGAQTSASLDGAGPGRADLALNRQIRHGSARAATEVEALWPDPLVEGMTAEARRAGREVAIALRIGRSGDIEAAEQDLATATAEINRLERRIAEAGHALDSAIADGQQEARVLTFGITGAIGIVASALVLWLSALRRRRHRDDAARQAARRGERRLQALVRHGSDLITVVGKDGTVLYQAGAVESLLGFSAAELEGEKLAGRLHPDDLPVLGALLDVGEDESPAREIRLRRRDGEYRTCEARATSLLGDDLWNGIVLNVWDVTERKELEERLRHQAFHDGLTGLANRVLFNERLEHALVRGMRTGRAVSVLMIDLDDFKTINDSFGHPAGDRLLVEAAGRIDETMRGADTVARLGGDEFGVILDDSLTPTADREAAARIVATLALPFDLDGGLPVSASIGIARAAAREARADHLIRDADLAMYAAKAEQKGSVAVYHAEMYAATEERLQLKGDLARAVAARDQLALYYQPVVDLRDGEIVGFEALLRWNHPTRGLVSPAEFIPLAEETGAIVEIGRRVLAVACHEAAGWIESSGRDLFVTANVSVRQLGDEALVAHVRSALRHSGLAPERLVLEVTETQLMRNVKQAVAVLRRVREMGVRIAIDDFGTGYSSLSQLERLPVDILKVDRDFAGDAASGRAGHGGLLGAVMEIGESLELATIAEGIETPEQLEQLRRLDYPLGQGYLFSKPVPADEVVGLLAKKRAGV
jgi:diguanylate cyclase (GGDEF)-like protein/PAS domain S-box-containing protein